MSEVPPSTAVDTTSISLRKVASGKVRDIFEIDQDSLLIVATDRCSAFDVVMENAVPWKGALLTQLSLHWFDLIKSRIPGLQTHVLPDSTSPALPWETIQLKLSSMRVRRLPVIPIESIVRGYITGSAWAEYERSGTVHGMSMPTGLREGQKLDGPIWTPSTKAEAGQHDENISRDQAVDMIGGDLAAKIEHASLEIYTMASEYAEERGIIIADTKFEFGFDSSTNEIVLIDEVLTPDSSRFWPKDQYEASGSQASYDKQYLRDWLVQSGLKGQPGVTLPAYVVDNVARKYREAYVTLTGKQWSQA